ncbi:MAG TPA: asparaginase [Pseudonocardiaceae bacterium]|nr:asparaginase [Pseudonocardiaceae bacterium]
MHEVVAEVWRGELAESVHHGTVVGLDADGAVAFSIGTPDAVVFPRSSNKPLQALAMVRAGLDLDGELLALACASHSGEDFHLEGVREILTKAGLTEADLQTPPDLPLSEDAQRAKLAAGFGPEPLFMNCSGKHAAMLLTCVRNGWPTATYRDPEHPLQLLIAETVEELTGERIGAVSVDGCGAPLFGFSLHGLARAFRTIATARTGTDERRIADAMNAFPQWVGGTGRDVTRLMRALPGSVCKDGAEGVHAIALADGRAVTLKIADGASRARPTVLVAGLRALGVSSPALEEIGEVPVLGHAEPVGSIRPAGALAQLLDNA